MKLRLVGRRRWVALGLAVFTAVGGAQLALHGSIEIARQRWTRMAPDERVEIATRYRDFRELDEEEQQALRRRARRLSALQEELLLELPETARQRLENLEPQKRRRVVRDMLEDELRSRGLRVQETLPIELARDLESAPPQERRRMLRDFDRSGRRTRLANLARELGCEDELGDLARLDDEGLDARLFELRRRLIERTVAEEGLPRWLSAEEWDALAESDDATFTRRWRAARNRRYGDTERPDGTRPNPFERLLLSLRPDPSWHVEHSHLTAEERRDAVYRMAKHRSLKLMESLAVDPSEIERFRGLDGPAFVEAMRDLARRYRDEPR